MVGAPRTDWIVDALGGERQDSATALVFPAPAEFTLSARVTVSAPRTTYDAGALVLWADPDHWAKLAFEQSPQGEGMVVSVVTNSHSDDSNAFRIGGDTAWLRISRVGPGWALHASVDGARWELVRIFRLYAGGPVSVGFLAQSPTGGDRAVEFASIALAASAPADLRDGS